MLRPAQAGDAGFILQLWTAPENALWLDPPEDGDVDRAIDAGQIMIWDQDGPMGFALMQEWLAGVWGLRIFATRAPGTGRVFLSALLTEWFGARAAHRIGLDTTADNARALAFFTQMGFQREGVWRECWRRPSGDWVDCVFMSMLAREWGRS